VSVPLGAGKLVSFQTWVKAVSSYGSDTVINSLACRCMEASTVHYFISEIFLQYLVLF